MVRVNRFDEPYSVRLRIDGLLTADFVPQVEQEWQQAAALARGRKLLLDASGVTRIDSTGHEFLAGLRRAGVKVDDDGRYLQAGSLSRHNLAARIRRRLCAALCALVSTLHRCPCGQRG